MKINHIYRNIQAYISRSISYEQTLQVADSSGKLTDSSGKVWQFPLYLSYWRVFALDQRV